MGKQSGMTNIDAPLLRVFQGEVGRQCRYAIVAYGDMELALRGAQKPEGEERFWYSVQAFLVAAANVSKLLWPICEMRERGKQLRDGLSVADSSPLKSKSLRNVFEHFDERLQKWAAKYGSDSLLVDSNIAPKQSMFTAGTPREAYLRNFDPSTWQLTFRSVEYDVREVLDEIRSIAQRADEVLKH